MHQGQVPLPEPLSVGDAPGEGAVTAAADILPSLLTSCMPCLRPRRLTPGASAVPWSTPTASPRVNGVS